MKLGPRHDSEDSEPEENQLQGSSSFFSLFLSSSFFLSHADGCRVSARLDWISDLPYALGHYIISCAHIYTLWFIIVRVLPPYVCLKQSARDAGFMSRLVINIIHATGNSCCVEVFLVKLKLSMKP